MTAPDVTDPTAAVRLADRLVAETRDELRRADAKAAQWLAMMGAGAVAVVTAWAAQGGSPWQRSASAIELGALGCVCALVAAAAFGMALTPRLGGGPDVRTVAYFGHVHRIGDPARVRRYIEAGADDTMPGLVSQLCALSRLTILKYRYIRVGTAAGVLAGCLILAASI